MDGASLAVSHLVEWRYDPADVAIAPREFEVVAREGLGVRVQRGLVRGAVLGAVAMTVTSVVAVIGIERLVRSTLPSVLVAAGIGACLGIIAGVIHHRQMSVVAFDDAGPELRPTTFDVVVDRDSDGARHDLARWWDPAAPRVRRQLVA